MVECACDPPGSGEEFCTGHCVLHAEIERLTQADRQWADHVKRLADERDRLRVELRTCQETLTACLESES